MAKVAKAKPKIKASKVTALGGKGAAPIKRRGRPKKLQTLAEVKAAIDAKNPTFVSPITGGKLPGTGPKIDPSKLVPDTVDDELRQKVENNSIKITKLKNILKLRRENDPTDEIAEVSLILQDIGNALSQDFANRITQEKDAIATLRGTADRKKRTGAEAGIEAVKKIGGTIGKAFDTVTAPAKNILDKSFDPKLIKKMNDEEAIEYLSSLRQIGRWSAEMILLFTYNRSNIWPIQDIGLLRAISKNYKKKYLPPDRFVFLLSKRFTPYCSVATWYLWRSIDPEPIQY